MEYLIKEILEYRGNHKKKTEIEFLVSWLGFSVDCNSLEPFANLRDIETAPAILNPSKVAKIDSSKVSMATHIQRMLSSYVRFSSYFLL